MSRKKLHRLNSFSFEECWERIKGKTPLENYSQLAEIIELSKSNVTKRKDENLFPVEWAFVVARRYGLTTEWILTGEEEKKLEQLKKRREFAILDECEEWLKEEVRKNPERKVWFELQLLDSFQTFAEWRRKRDEEKGGEPGHLSSMVA